MLFVKEPGAPKAKAHRDLTWNEPRKRKDPPTTPPAIKDFMPGLANELESFRRQALQVIGEGLEDLRQQREALGNRVASYSLSQHPEALSVFAEVDRHIQSLGIAQAAD